MKKNKVECNFYGENQIQNILVIISYPMMRGDTVRATSGVRPHSWWDTTRHVPPTSKMDGCQSRDIIAGESAESDGCGCIALLRCPGRIFGIGRARTCFLWWAPVDVCSAPPSPPIPIPSCPDFHVNLNN